MSSSNVTADYHLPKGQKADFNFVLAVIKQLQHIQTLVLELNFSQVWQIAYRVTLFPETMFSCIFFKAYLISIVLFITQFIVF